MAEAAFQDPFPQELVELAKAIFRLGSTKLNEDIFQRLRHTEAHHQNAPVMRPARVWQTAVSSSVLQEHEVKEITSPLAPGSDVDAGAMPPRLPTSFYKPVSIKDMNFEEVTQFAT